MANFANYFTSGLVIIFGILAVSLATFNCINPGVKDQIIKCSDLLEATHPKTNYPYLGQGILLTIGVIFFIVVLWNGDSSTTPERQESRRMEWIFAAAVFIGICLCLSVGALYIGSSSFMSPSFIATCQPLQPQRIDRLCVETSPEKEITVAQLNCAADEHTLAFTGSCNPIMITIQSFLMSILFVSTISVRVTDANIFRVVVNYVMVTFFPLGIGMAAMNANEAYLLSVFLQSLIGIVVAAVTLLIFAGLIYLATNPQPRQLNPGDLENQGLPAAPNVPSLPTSAIPPSVVTQSDPMYPPLESVVQPN